MMETQTATATAIPAQKETVFVPMCMPIQQQSFSIDDYFKDESFNKKFRHNMGNINQSIYR